MSELDFTEKTKQIIRERAEDQCELHDKIEESLATLSKSPKDLPKIDFNNPLHTKLVYHHANFKSSAMPGLNEDWNGVYIYQFYHDLIHSRGKWGIIFANACRAIAESRRPVENPQKREAQRMDRHAKKLEKNSETRAKNKKKRKENPWMNEMQRKELSKGFEKGKGKSKKFTKVKIDQFYNRHTGKLEKCK